MKYKLVSAISILSLSIILSSCRKDEKEIDVKSLIIGNWKLTQFKQDNQPWKDSTGTFYKFINDTLVNTEIFSHMCDRKYGLESSTEGLKRVRVFPNYSCFYQSWISFSVVSINNNSMEITYPDYIGGGPLIKKYEKYIKE